MGNSLPMQFLAAPVPREPFPEIPVVVLQHPVLVVPIPYEFVIRRPRPILDHANQAMFHRIAVNIVDVPLQILFIPYLMFPETPLPYTTFSLLLPRHRHGCLRD